jgi:hypothetical protein
VIRRDEPKQGEPVDVDASFPHVDFPREPMFRCHRWRPESPDGGCWSFHAVSAPDGVGGRFDLPSPMGTCYWASTALSAARERLGRAGDLVAADEVADVVVTRARVGAGVAADVLDVDAPRRGVITELSVTTDYPLSRRWAVAFSEAGFDGIRYQPRFSSDRAYALAVFGGEGVPSSAPAIIDSIPTRDVLVEHGYTLLPIPRSADLGPLID